MTTPIRRGLARRFGELTGEGARGNRGVVAKKDIGGNR